MSSNLAFSAGYHNIEGLHNRSGCKASDIANELTCDIEILTETWGCGCTLNFGKYEIIDSVAAQKHKYITKGRKSGGIKILLGHPSQKM